MITQLLPEQQNESPWGHRHCCRHSTLKIKVLHSWNLEIEYKPQHLQSWAIPRI